MNHLVSVIIPHKNDSDRLQLCIDALLKQTYPRDLFEIIIVDNGSDYYHLNKVLTFSDPEKIFVESEPSNGSYAARNKGILKSRGKYLAFTDSDCIPYENWLENGVKIISGNDNLGFLSGKIEMFYSNNDNPNFIELFDFITHFKQEIYIDMNFGVTANLFTSKIVINKAGPFNDELISCGDVEWCKRVSRNGYKLEYDKRVIVKHPARNSIGNFIKKQIRVSKGNYDLDRLYGRSKFDMFLQNCIELKPPVITTYKLLRSERIKVARSFSKKLKIITFYIFIRYFRVYERFKLLLGLERTTYK